DPPGRARLNDQLHRAPGAGRAAPGALRGDRRARARDRGHRLRVRDLRAVGQPGRARDRLGEVQSDGRGRAAGVPATLEIAMAPDEIDVPHALVRVLEEAGIQFVFGMPGGDTGRIFD